MAYKTRASRRSGNTGNNKGRDIGRAAWSTMTPPQKRRVMRDPNQHTPNPQQGEFTFKVPPPRLRNPFKK